MSVLSDIWRQLVRRRLWPVAVLLVAALAAVPLILKKEPTVNVEASAPAAAPTTPASSELAEQPIVTASTASTREPGRKPLGKQRDIFESTAKQPKAAKVETPKAVEVAEQPKQEAGTTAPSSGGGATTSPAAPVTSTPAPKPKTYAQYSLAVRFGSTDSDLTRSTLPRMKALPSSEQPLLIYLGLLGDHKTAVFLLDASATAQGDGECHPTPESCETIRLKAGETEFIDVVDANGATIGQYQLDLVKIHKSQTDDAAKAARSSSLARVASVGGVSTAVRGLGASAARSR